MSLHLAAFEVGQKLRLDVFSFADDDRVGVLPDLFGHQRRMWPANNDGNPSAAILSRQPVGVGRSRRVGRDADQIDWRS